MARRSMTYCGIRRVLPDVEQGSFTGDSDYRYALTWCGDKKLSTERERGESLRLVTCPKCAAAIGKAKLAKLGGRVELERDEKPLSYHRSSYRLLVDGAHRGWIACESGWGKGWHLYGLNGPGEYGDFKRLVYDGRYGNKPTRWNASDALKTGKELDAWPVHFAARDAMAALAVAMVDAGKLPTAQELEEREERRKVERAAQEAESARLAEERRVEREAREALRLERLELWREALASLDGRADLTNLERAGLEAVKLLYP